MLHKFWAEALSTAVYLKYRNPSRGLKKTTLCIDEKEAKKVDHLHVFRCDPYVHIPSDERNKLNSKPRNPFSCGGNGTKGYRQYDPQ